MTNPALDLLLRVAAERLRDEQCPGCGFGLSGVAVRPRAQKAEGYTVAVGCPGCGRELLVDIEPDG